VSELREQVDIETKSLENLYLKITSIPKADPINAPDKK
jgi:hypothetical protein